MPGYVLSPDALQDLQDIWDFIAFDNVNAADQLEDEFFDAFENLARRPQIGHFRRDLSEREVRFWPVGSYLIVYRQVPRVLEIVAVLHGARDVPAVIRKREAPLL
jgi:plasmid stabilization system protein ParE